MKQFFMLITLFFLGCLVPFSTYAEEWESDFKASSLFYEASDFNLNFFGDLFGQNKHKKPKETKGTIFAKAITTQEKIIPVTSLGTFAPIEFENVLNHQIDYADGIFTIKTDGRYAVTYGVSAFGKGKVSVVVNEENGSCIPQDILNVGSEELVTHILILKLKVGHKLAVISDVGIGLKGESAGNITAFIDIIKLPK